MYWDEQEETVDAWGRILLVLALVAGLACLVLSLWFGSPAPFMAYALWVGMLALLIVGYGLLVSAFVGAAVLLARGFHELWKLISRG